MVRRYTEVVMPLAPLTPTDTRLFCRPLSAELSRLLQGLPAAASQIRDAAGAPSLHEPSWLHAVLSISMRGLPHAYRHAAAETGETVAIQVTGPGGGLWTLRREPQTWTLWAGIVPDVSAHVRMSDDTAWRLLFNALPEAHLSSLLTVSGKTSLVEPLTRARSVIV